MMWIDRCILFLLSFALLPNEATGKSSHQAQITNSTKALVDFQVYKPVEFQLKNPGQALLLIDHQFANSYGRPFVGNYEPPSCIFDTVRINLTVTSIGHQFDRLALMFLGDIEIFRTSTAEPTADGIIYTYIKEMSQYLVLWREKQKLIFDLGNQIDNTYTGTYNVTLTASFSQQGNVRMADVILPISTQQSSNNTSSAFIVPLNDAILFTSIPVTASRAVVSIAACGQLAEEFWWSNVFSQDMVAFRSTVGDLYGYSPFREIQLFIDGILAGVVWPFPIIFTGGISPGFWRPIVGIDAFDLREPEIDISPFLPLLTNGHSHSFQIKVAGLSISADGAAVLTEFVGLHWVITGKIFLYLDGSGDVPVDASQKGVAPKIVAPDPAFIITRNLIQDPLTGTNESLSYAVKGERVFSVSSSHFKWSQKLTYSNSGLLNQQGFSQRNIQNISGTFSSSKIGVGGSSSRSSSYNDNNTTSFAYPLDVNSTYNITDSGFTINALMNRGLDITSNSGGLGISTFTLSSGPSTLNTQQRGVAHYSSVTSGSTTGSFSTGDTSNTFEETSRGTTYRRNVRAVDGTVIDDTTSSNGRRSRTLLYSSASGVNQRRPSCSLERSSVRSILGRGLSK